MVIHGHTIPKKAILVASAFSVIVSLSLVAVTIFIATRQTSTSDQTKAAQNSSTANYASDFKEVSTPLTTPDLYFANDHNVTTRTKPATATVNGRTVTLNGKTGAIYKNPLANEPFYKISVTFKDTDSDKIVTYLGAMRELWKKGSSPKGISVGVNAITHDTTYHFEHTEHAEGYAKLNTKAKKDITDKYWSRFIPRTAHDVLLEIYVTPVGTYAVIDRINTFTFPNDYAGKPFLSAGPINYIVLGKWNTDKTTPVTFTDLQVTKLDGNISDAQEISAFFVKKAVDENHAGIMAKVRNKSLKAPDAVNATEAIWMALVLRSYDFYFNKPGRHINDVRELLAYALNEGNLRAELQSAAIKYDYANIKKNDEHATCMARCETQCQSGASSCPADQQKGIVGCESPTECGKTAGNLNHDVMNGLTGPLFALAHVNDYFDPAVKEEYRKALAPFIDQSLNIIKGDGPYQFPLGGDQYVGDTFMEEYAWMVAVYSSYYSLYYYDNDPTQQRASRILEYLIFLDHHGYADKKQSLRKAFGSSFEWKFLNSALLDFETQTVYPDGTIDNHGWHPSANYGSAALSVMPRTLIKRVAGIDLPMVRTNQDKILQKNFVEIVDVATLRRKPGATPGLATTKGAQRELPPTLDGYWLDQNRPGAQGIVNSFQGWAVPSLLEDWGNSFTQYYLPIIHGSPAFGEQLARTVYFSQYNSKGRLNCLNFRKATGSNCFHEGLFSYIVGEPVWAMIYAPQSTFSGWQAPPSRLTVSDDGSNHRSTVNISPSGTTLLKMDIPLSGKAEVRIDGSKIVVVDFVNGQARLASAVLGAEKSYTISVRPQMDPRFSANIIAGAEGYAWSSSATILVSQGGSQGVSAAAAEINPNKAFDIEVSTNNTTWSKNITIKQGQPYYVSTKNLNTDVQLVTKKADGSDQNWIVLTKGKATVDANLTKNLLGSFTATARRANSPGQAWSAPFTVTVQKAGSVAIASPMPATPTPTPTPTPVNAVSGQPTTLTATCGRSVGTDKVVTIRWKMSDNSASSYYLGINRNTTCTINGQTLGWKCPDDIEITMPKSSCGKTGVCRFETKVPKGAVYSNYAITAIKDGVRSEGKSTAGFTCK